MCTTFRLWLKRQGECPKLSPSSCRLGCWWVLSFLVPYRGGKHIRDESATKDGTGPQICEASNVSSGLIVLGYLRENFILSCLSHCYFRPWLKQLNLCSNFKKKANKSKAELKDGEGGIKSHNTGPLDPAMPEDDLFLQFSVL